MKFLYTMTILFFMMLPHPSQAANMLSIRQLKEQLPERWTQSYQTKWREVSVDVVPFAPEADTLPILKVVPDLSAPDSTKLGPTWAGEIRDRGTFNVYQVDPPQRDKKAGEKAKTITFYPPFEDTDYHGLTFADLIAEAEDRIVRIHHGEWRMSPPLRLSINIPSAEQANDLHWLSYSLNFSQELVQIPILIHALSGVDDPKDGLPIYLPFLSYQGNPSGYARVGGRKVNLSEVVAEDVPLLDFSHIRAAIEEEITAGRIRKIFDVELGYALYNEPGATREQGTAWMKKTVFYALPVWAINCYYIENGEKQMRDYTDNDVPERSVFEYKTLIINAQTGKIMDRADNRPVTAEYPGFISWDEAGINP